MKQRHPFDIYRDQYEALQALALEERMQGGVGSMSAMVREAIDALLEQRRKEITPYPPSGEYPPYPWYYPSYPYP